jgi:hypothetical protein
VWLRIDGEDLTYPSGEPVEDLTPPYEVGGLAFPTGTYVLEALARDRAGLVAQSDPVTIHVGSGASEGGSGAADGDGDGAPGSGDHGAGTETGVDTDFSLEEGSVGCGCRERPNGGGAWSLVLALAYGRAKRRRPNRDDPWRNRDERFRSRAS